MTSSLQFCAVAGLCVAVMSCAAPPPPPPPVAQEIWPTKAWPVSTPEAQGIDSNALADAIAAIREKQIPVHSLLIVRNGHIVLDAYFFPFADNEPHDVASVTKSVTATLVGIALGERKLTDVNAPVLSLLPDEKADDPRKARITLANLLSMTSGLDCGTEDGQSTLAQMERSRHWTDYMFGRSEAAEPGSTFSYCAGNMHLASAVLSRATGESAFELARSELFAPLGITDATWPADPDGVSHGFADLRLEPRDLAKLGYLWLHNGRWEERQILPADYLAAALGSHADVQPGIQYGFGMWLYPGHAPVDFEANGRGGQRITVIPTKNIVEVMTGGGMDANDVMSPIAQAFKSDAPLPANDAGDARLAKLVATAAAIPVPVATASLPPLARQISGRTWFLSPNPLALHSLTLTFSSTNEAKARFGFADGSSEDHAIGLDGAARLSPNRSSGLAVALSGQFQKNGFAFDYDEIARINAYRLVLTPDAQGLSIHLTERSGLTDMMVTARAEAPAARTASLDHAFPPPLAARLRQGFGGLEPQSSEAAEQRRGREERPKGAEGGSGTRRLTPSASLRSAPPP